MAKSQLDVTVNLANKELINLYALVRDLTKANALMWETLQFYANPDNHRSSGYNPFGGYGASEIDRDAGQRARDILKERL